MKSAILAAALTLWGISGVQAQSIHLNNKSSFDFSNNTSLVNTSRNIYPISDTQTSVINKDNFVIRSIDKILDPSFWETPFDDLKIQDYKNRVKNNTNKAIFGSSGISLQQYKSSSFIEKNTLRWIYVDIILKESRSNNTTLSLGVSKSKSSSSSWLIPSTTSPIRAQVNLSVPFY